MINLQGTNNDGDLLDRHRCYVRLLSVIYFQDATINH